MSLKTAFKLFFRALKNPQAAESSMKISEKPPLDKAHLNLLSILQKEGRLLDFFQENISGYTDQQVGAAVRDIHENCRKELNELLELRPVMDCPEGSVVTIPETYNTSEIKLVGRVVGSPPYEGVLVHKGWRATKQMQTVVTVSDDVIVSAEVEVR